MSDELLSKIADRIDRAADRLRFTGKIADADACSQAASRIRAGMSIKEAQAIEAYLVFGISSGVRTRLSALSGSGEYDGGSAVTSAQPEGATTLSLNSPDLPPAGQPGQAGMGMETISQNMQYAAALSQDAYVDPYNGVQYPTNPLLADPLNGGPSPYYPRGQSVNSYNATSPAASPSGQAPDLYSAFQNFNSYTAPSSGFDSSISPFFPGAGGTLDTSQMWASNGPTPAPDSIASGNGSIYMPVDVLQGQTPKNMVRRNGEQDLHYQITIGKVAYDAYFNDLSTQIPPNMVELVPSSQAFSNVAAPAAPQPAQPIPAPPAPAIDSSAVIPFYYPPDKGDIFLLTQYHDTGSTFQNYAVNWLYGYRNLAEAIVNFQGEYFAYETTDFLSFVADIDRAIEGGLRSIGFSDIDIQAARDFNPLFAGEAAIEIYPGALSYLQQELSAFYADERGAINLSRLSGMAGPGSVLPDFSLNNMSEAAAAYQARAGGLPRGMGYYVNGPTGPVQFDGYLNGALIETKFYESDGLFVNAANAFIENPNTYFAQNWHDYRIYGEDGIVSQAQRQVTAAGNYPVVWRVASQEAAVIIQQIFGAHGFNIQVVYFP